jgi:dihydrofolate reductase
MKIALIVAVSQNNVIGRDNQLPWHLPEDLQYFKSVTMGKPILMGRKTFESIGRPLPGRVNIVITRDPDWTAEGVAIVNTIDDAMAAGAVACKAANSDEIMIIGGAQISMARSFRKKPKNN